MSDHQVSEAIYLDDPDGIGIELYSDRPRSEWIHRDGGIVMAVDPLDVGNLLAALPSEPDPMSGMPGGMTIGHVHLNVSNIPESQTFYCDVLGLDITFHMHSALFISAGGYHHHLGLNTWNGVGAPPPPPGSIGLHHYTIEFADNAALDTALSRLNAEGITVVETAEGFWLKDPSTNKILLTTK
jgi:catechol 2,3-dioxygenase